MWCYPPRSQGVTRKELCAQQASFWSCYQKSHSQSHSHVATPTSYQALDSGVNKRINITLPLKIELRYANTSGTIQERRYITVATEVVEAFAAIEAIKPKEHVAATKERPTRAALKGVEGAVSDFPRTISEQDPPSTLARDENGAFVP